MSRSQDVRKLLEALPDYPIKVANPDNLSPEEVAVFTIVSRDRSGVGHLEKSLEKVFKKDYKHVQTLIKKKYLKEVGTLQGTFVKLNDDNSNAFLMAMDVGKLPSEILLMYSRVKKFLKKNMNK